MTTTTRTLRLIWVSLLGVLLLAAWTHQDATGGAGPAKANTYYVSPAGSDANAGTSPEQAWRTLEKVSDTDVPAGYHILFEGGQTFNGTLKFGAADGGTADAPIVVSSYGVGRATLDAGDGTGIEVYNVAGLELKSLDVIGSGVETNTGTGVSLYTDLPGDGRLEHIYIDDVDVSGFLEGGLVMGGYNNETYGRGFKDVRVTNSRFHDNGDSGVQSYGYWEANSDSSDYAHEDVYIGMTEVYNNVGKVGKGNNTGNGVVLGSVDGAVIEHSKAYNNGERNDFEDGGPVGIWAWDSNDVTIQFNESYNNKTGSSKDGGGFDLDGGVTNSVVQYNYAHGNDGAGYLMGQFGGSRPLRNNVIRYNLSVNDGRKNGYAGIELFKAPDDTVFSDAAIYGNTVVIGPAEGDTPAAFKIFDWGDGIRNVGVYNNIFFTQGDAEMVNLPGGDELSFVGNAYHATGAFKIIDTNDSYPSLAAWQAATGQEVHDGVKTGLETDPLLVNPDGEAADDFRLTGASPLIDAGFDLTAAGLEVGPHDFYGNAVPQGAAFDMGAHEFSR